VQGNGPRASRLRASGVRAVQEQCAGDATGHGDPAGGYAGVPTVFLQHTRVSSGALAHEQENPKIREGVGIANQSSPIGFFLESTTSNSSYLHRSSEQDHNTPRGSSWTPIEPLRSLYARTSSPCQSQPPSSCVTVRNTSPVILHPLQSPGKLLHHPRNLVTVEHFSSPILFIAGIHFPPVLLHNQGYPTVCPDSLNLPNAGDPFAGISLLSSCSLFSPTRDLIALI
jgi:hypothetical protein